MQNHWSAHGALQTRVLNAHAEKAQKHITIRAATLRLYTRCRRKQHADYTGGCMPRGCHNQDLHGFWRYCAVMYRMATALMAKGRADPGGAGEAWGQAHTAETEAIPTRFGSCVGLETLGPCLRHYHWLHRWRAYKSREQLHL